MHGELTEWTAAARVVAAAFADDVDAVGPVRRRARGRRAGARARGAGAARVRLCSRERSRQLE
jgi:hypothetical protein